MNKKYILLFIAASFVFTMYSCKKNYLDQKSTTLIFEDDAYVSINGINAVAADLYAGIRYEQDFATDPEGFDLCSFDEAYNNSQYGSDGGYKGEAYRTHGPYVLVKKINLHIQNLNKYNSPSVTAADKKYFLAEARFIRAMVYFNMVSRVGGMPLITELYEYPTTDPQKLAKPRNKEHELYDFIASEIDAIANDLDVKAPIGSGKYAYAKNRATKGAALALKCRAMLYAGTIAKNAAANQAKNLILSSGVVGIPASMADGYFQKCLDAFNGIKALGYTLYNTDIATGRDVNYTNIFLKKDVDNPESIFVKDYDGGGTNTYNPFTRMAIPRSMRTVTTHGAQYNPVLNLVEKYEVVSTKANTQLKTNTGAEVIEEMSQNTSSLSYQVYNNIADIFTGRDPRLFGTVLTPGSTFRNNAVKLQAGLATWGGSSYTFRHVADIKDAAVAAGMYNGMQMTGEDGPHRVNWYCSHSGFLIRKFLDPTPGSEIEGKSGVPYVVFRYGEMLLNAAEAAYQLGKMPEALDYINQVRERAGGAGFRITQAELTMERIRNERAVELAFEDHRYNDLKRWRLADELWNGSNTNPQAVLYALWPYKISRPGHSSDGKYLYRRLRLRGTKSTVSKDPLRFTLGMYYPILPSALTGTNPLLEPNPNH